jgi:hypothetical protein
MGLIALISSAAAAAIQIYNRWRRRDPASLDGAMNAVRQVVRVVAALVNSVDSLLNALAGTPQVVRSALGGPIRPPLRIGEPDPS